jgi:hypothetical protein
MMRGLSVVSSRAMRILRIAVLTACSEFDELSVFPELALDLVARDEFPGTVGQKCEQARRLILKLNASACLAELSGMKVQFERFEAYTVLPHGAGSFL